MDIPTGIDDHLQLYEMTGVVLCGGASTRMGSDKGLLKQKQQTWAELAETKLSSLKIPVVISVNEKQQALYSAIFSPDKLIVDSSNINVKGPLLGLLTVHLHFPEENLFVLACDMTNMTIGYLGQLYSKYKPGKQEAYLYSTEGKLQPLCSIYTADGLKKVHSLYLKNELRKFSMMYVLDQLQTDVTDVSGENIPIFNNYNTPIS